ncbi:MAG: hypothetical protein K6U74_11230 [Firmicutes bacterium]|nr:hypothetical protein [Bacillota bacterium]
MVNTLAVLCEKKYPGLALSECAAVLGIEPERFRDILAGAVIAPDEVFSAARALGRERRRTVLPHQRLPNGKDPLPHLRQRHG